MHHNAHALSERHDTSEFSVSFEVEKANFPLNCMRIGTDIIISNRKTQQFIMLRCLKVHFSNANVRNVSGRNNWYETSGIYNIKI